MRNITFSADEHQIEAARERALRENSTLNEEFRRWLRSYAGGSERADAALQVVKELRKSIATGGRRFTRDEMNER